MAETINALSQPIWSAAGVFDRFSDARDRYLHSDAYHDWYVPNGVANGVSLNLPPRASGLLPLLGLEATGTLMLYTDRFDAPRFGARGEALAGLLYPAFEAGVRAYTAQGRHRATLTALLDAHDEALALFDAARAPPSLHTCPCARSLPDPRAPL